MRRWARHMLLLGGGLVLLALLIHLSRADIWRQLGDLRFGPLAWALAATVGITGVSTARWGSIANALGRRRMVSWLDYYHYLIVSHALAFIVPKDVADLGGRTLSLKQFHGLSLIHAGSSVALDRLSDVVITSMFLAPGLLYLVGWIEAPAGIGLMATVAIGGAAFVYFGHGSVAAVAVWLLDRVLVMIRRLPWLGKRPGELPRADSLDRDQLFRVYLLSLAKFAFTAARFTMFAWALDLPISPELIVLGMPAGQLSYLFAFTPGGIGIFEAGWFAILRAGGVDGQSAATFVVGQRVFTVGLIGGLAVLSQMVFVGRRYFMSPEQDAVTSSDDGRSEGATSGL